MSEPSFPLVDIIETDIPFRLDRLPWSRFHWLLVIALGVTWVLDGLEATVVGSIGAVLENPTTLGLTAYQVGLAGTLTGRGIGGALPFGYSTDQPGRKRLFTVPVFIWLPGPRVPGTRVVPFRVVTDGDWG
jgi:MFS family permease